MPGSRGGENDDENSSIILLGHTSIEHGIPMKNLTDSRGDRRVAGVIERVFTYAGETAHYTA